MECPALAAAFFARKRGPNLGLRDTGSVIPTTYYRVGGDCGYGHFQIDFGHNFSGYNYSCLWAWCFPRQVLGSGVAESWLRGGFEFCFLFLWISIPPFRLWVLSGCFAPFSRGELLTRRCWAACLLCSSVATVNRFAELPFLSNEKNKLKLSNQKHNEKNKELKHENKQCHNTGRCVYGPVLGVGGVTPGLGGVNWFVTHIHLRQQERGFNFERL